MNEDSSVKSCCTGEGPSHVHTFRVSGALVETKALLITLGRRAFAPER
jgi:hypothetical protein